MIWYSHVNEDNRVERDLLLRGPYEQVVCVTGSGERALSLMDAAPLRAFHAVDINREANHLLELKLRILDHQGAGDYPAFCGLSGTNGVCRAKVAKEIVEGLSPDCREYWEGRMDLLLAGVAHCGHFERFLGRVRPPLRAVLGNGFEECFTLSRDAFRKFPFLRWKLLLRLFSHRWVYQLLGNRDPAFVAADARPILIARALQMTLEEDRVPDSFMFHLIFKGDLDAMSPERLPPSLRKEVLAAVRTKLHEPGFVIRFHEGDLRTVVGRWPQRDFSLTFFSVSDILSFTDFDYLLNFLQLLRGRHTSVVFRSFLRHGLTRDQLQTLRARFTEVEDVSHEEKTCLYRVYHVRV